MGFFNWFAAKPAARQSLSAQNDIHATLADATRPLTVNGKPAPFNNNQASPTQRLEQRRTERNARRELLFQVIRESMVRAGILSSAFKFKVLALDQRGQTFLVMIDLSAEFAGETDKLNAIEAMISQSAKNRFDLIVQAVYWRFYDSAVSNSVSRAHSAASAVSAPAPLFGLPIPTAPATADHAKTQQLAPPTRTPAAPAKAPIALNARTPALGTALPAGAQRPTPAAVFGADPLEQDEVAAFKRALASGSQPGLAIPLGSSNPIPPQRAPVAPTAAAAAAARVPVPAPAPVVKPAVPHPATLAAAAAAKAASMAAINNKLLLTGYEDTEMPDPDAPLVGLSTTQYGELR
jgi:hypothetical protein